MGKTASKNKQRGERWVKDATWQTLGEIDALKEPRRINDIALIVARYFGVTRSDIRGKSRWWIDVAARQITMALAVRFTDKSINMIAQVCCRSCHTNVRVACRKYDDMLDYLLENSGIQAPPRRIEKIDHFLEALQSAA